MESSEAAECDVAQRHPATSHQRSNYIASSFHMREAGGCGVLASKVE